MKRVLARLFLVALLAGCGAGGGSLGSSSGTSTGGSAQATVPAANSAAGGQTAVAPTSTATTDTSNLPAAFARFPSSVVVYREGNFAVLETTDVPNHNSPYFPTSSPLYAPYDGSNPNFVKNPNQILSQHIVLRIPIAPQEAAQKQLTPLGPMGISLNGVVFYNQYAAGRSPLTGEINSFDQHGGHPSPGNQYHYHVEPTYLTGTLGKSALIGFLLDGYPVYGPSEAGRTLTSADLDAYHGHSHATPDYPGGIYHYHVTADAPYINGAAYFGTPGTVAQ